MSNRISKEQARQDLPLSQRSRDEELVQRARQGELEAFDFLIRRYERRVIGLCLRHVGQYEEACDLAQEIFLKVFRHLQSFQGRSAFATWLYRICLNACYNRHRFLKSKSRGGMVSLEGMLEAKGGRQDETLLLKGEEARVLENLEAEEERRQLRLALQALPESHRSVLELVDIEGLSYGRSAAVLRIPVNTLRSRLSRARQDLKARLLQIRKRLDELP